MINQLFILYIIFIFFPWSISIKFFLTFLITLFKILHSINQLKTPIKMNSDNNNNNINK